MLKVPLEVADEELLRQASAWPEFPRLDDLSSEILRDISAAQGIDFATALLYARICASPRYCSFIDSMSAVRGEQDSAWSAPANAPLIGIVPALYDEKRWEHESSGEFLRKHVEQLGYRTERVPVPSFRLVTEGADIIRQWLRQQRERTILFSLSFGSTEAKLALQHRDPGEEFPALAAWVNVTGPVKGSPLVNLLQGSPLRWGAVRTLLWIQRRDPTVFTEFKHGPGTKLWEPLSAPPNLPIYHLLGFPLQRHYPRAIRNFGEKVWWKMTQRLKLGKYGPNDAVAVLGDILTEPGLVYPIWGVPHWLTPQWDIERLITRLLMHIDQQP